jgi:glutathione S-transferase
VPVPDFPVVARWHRRLEAIDAWRDLFAGLNAPALPPIPGGSE